MAERRAVKYIHEPTDLQCGQAVLAMLTGLTTEQVAKELNMTVHELTHLLIEQNVMYKQSGQYMLYKDYAHKGYAKNRTHSYYDGEGCMHTSVYLVWTEEGRKFIHRLLSDEEIIVPFILTIND